MHPIPPILIIPIQRLTILPNILPILRLPIPINPKLITIFIIIITTIKVAIIQIRILLRLIFLPEKFAVFLWSTDHFVGEGAENSFHHGHVFGVGVGLEHADAHVPFEDDAADGPDVAGVGPAEF